MAMLVQPHEHQCGKLDQLSGLELASAPAVSLHKDPGQSIQAIRQPHSSAVASRRLHHSTVILAPPSSDGPQSPPKAAAPIIESDGQTISDGSGMKQGQDAETEFTVLDYVYFLVFAAFIVICCTSVWWSCCCGYGALLMQAGRDDVSIASAAAR